MKYLVELNSSDVKADFLLSEMHLEFGRSPESTNDPDILRLNVGEAGVQVLCDYDNNRLWVTIDTASDSSYESIAHRIEGVLNRSKDRGDINWSQIEIKE
jgi:hypothetical protein